MKWLDNMVYTSPVAAGQSTASRPTAAQLGLTAAVYTNGQYDTGATGSTPTADVKKAAAVANCMPYNTTAMIDVETWTGKMVRYNGLGQPIPDDNRYAYQVAIANTYNAMKATSRGATCQLGPYTSTLGALDPENPESWHTVNLATQQQIFNEPVPGAPNGIGNLFDVKIVSCYVFYSDIAKTQRRIARLAQNARAIYPGKKITGAIMPRCASKYDIFNDRFDFLSGPQMKGVLATMTALFDDILLWDFNGYGPEGTKQAGRQPGTGYSLAGGCAWNENAAWWNEVKRYKATATIKAGGGVSTGTGRIR